MNPLSRMAVLSTPRTDKALWHTRDGVRVVDYAVMKECEQLLGLCAELLEECESYALDDELAGDIEEALKLFAAQRA